MVGSFLIAVYLDNEAISARTRSMVVINVLCVLVLGSWIYAIEVNY